MKHTISVLVLLVGFVLVGCSDRSATTGPVSNDVMVPGQALPGSDAIDQGTMGVDHSVIVPGLGSKYDLRGSIDFVRVDDGVNYNLMTRVNVDGQNAESVDEEAFKVASASKQIAPKAPGIVVMTERHDLSGALSGYALQLEYAVGSSVELQNVEIVSSLMKARVK